MDKDLIRKLQSEAPLTREEQVELELAIEETNRSHLRSSVQGLPEDLPSMAWRSGLNESLKQLSQRSKPKSRLGWRWISASAVSLVGAGALLFMLMKPHVGPPPSGPNSSVEAALVASHIESVSAIESGAAITPRPTANSLDGNSPWNEADIEAL